MTQNNNFNKLFPRKAIIGMIHLAGKDRDERVCRALEELRIYEEEGIDGAIIEDYHGNEGDVLETLKQSSTQNFRIVRGVNLLRDPYSAFDMTSKFGGRFVQFDSVQTPELDLERYELKRRTFPEILVFGGVGFKYTRPTGNPLELDLEEGKSRCDAIVTTGDGTGIETPIDKLRKFQGTLRDFPLIVGAGVTLDNAYMQLSVTDGAIVGSYFKPNGNTHFPIERRKVRDLVSMVRKIEGSKFT